MINYNAFKNEVTTGLAAKYDQGSLFDSLNTFSFNQYYKSCPEQVITIIKVYYNSIKGREDVQEYLITECQHAIIEKSKESKWT